MNEHAGDEEYDPLEQFRVPDEVRAGLTLAYLRPYALRALWQVLVDVDVNPRLRLEAAKLVVERTKDGAETGAGADAVAEEVADLVESLRRRG